MIHILKFMNGGLRLVKFKKKLSSKIKFIIKRLISGILGGIANYVFYFIFPDLIYKSLYSYVSQTYPQISGITGLIQYIPAFTINTQILALFIILSCASSLFSGSWFGYIISISVSAYFLMYALDLMNYGLLSIEIENISVKLDFSILAYAWFITFILESLARAFDYIEHEAGFLPSI